MKLIMGVCKDHSSIEETTTFTSYYFRKVFLHYEINAIMMCREQITLRIEVLSKFLLKTGLAFRLGFGMDNKLFYYSYNHSLINKWNLRCAGMAGINLVVHCVIVNHTFYFCCHLPKYKSLHDRQHPVVVYTILIINEFFTYRIYTLVFMAICC